MKKLFFYAAAAVAMASCSSNDYLGNAPDQIQQGTETGEIQFSMSLPNMTRAGEYVGATAAEKLGNMFVVEGTKGSEQEDSPSKDVVFDNYLVGYNYNTAGKTASNTHNWEYVGLQSGIDEKLNGTTWTALHPSGTSAQSQTIKYWDYSTDQYDFIAWSTGNCEAVADAAADGKVKVTRINTGNTLKTDGFKMTALSADDLKECYYTDINTVLKTNYNKPVTLTFKNMAAKVRVALYETVPGYSVKDVKFYTSDANPTAPEDLGTGTSTTAALFTMGSDVLPQSGEVTVMYPHIGTTHRGTPPTYAGQTADYNKASVSVATVAGGAAGSTTQTFGTLDAQYGVAQANEAPGNFYLGRTLPNATFAGNAGKNFYEAVIPNPNGHPLTLRVDYTLVAIDGSKEEIKVYGAKAVVPSTYTAWQPNYAYTYIFKISDNSNGWTSKTSTDKNGLFPITFDAVVASFTDANAEQTTVTTVATPSITTYQQGHTKSTNEYSKSQKAGANKTDVKDLYVQVMDNSGVTPTLKDNLSSSNSLLFKITKGTSDYVASEAEVMDALQNRTNELSSGSPKGRNGITLTKNDNISNTETTIVNGVDDQPITEIDGTAIAEGQVAKIDIDNVDVPAGTYAYVYVSTIPTTDEKVYHVATVSGADDEEKAEDAKKYYEVTLASIDTEAKSSGTHAAPGKVYFIKNVDKEGNFESWTFKQTKVGDDVEGLFEATIPDDKATSYTATSFYFDVYNTNKGSYAVKVFKVVE